MFCTGDDVRERGRKAGDSGSPCAGDGEDHRMRKKRGIDVAAATAMLRTRGELVALGHTERHVRNLIESGLLRRVRRGRYIFADDWDSLWNEGRHLVEVVAAHLNAAAGGLVFWGPSAAVLHELPLYRHTPDEVHVATTDARHSRAHAGNRWHNVEVASVDIVEIDGIRCTSLERTVLDLARSARPETAISVADAALRRSVGERHEHDAATAVLWRDRMLRRAHDEHGRGIRQARRVLEFADGRAQLPGESVSRYRLGQLGFTRYDLQMHVVGAWGDEYWLDFGFLGMHCFGEFDGESKYLDEAIRGDRTIERVLLDEKRREDDIRGVTGWRIVRWGSKDIASLDAFAAKLAAFGIRPPG